MRINKYLAQCGVCSRRKADELVRQGRVSVNKRVITEVGTDVDEAGDVVYVDGKKVVMVTHFDYFMFNKPKGCVTTVNDEKDDKSGRPVADASSTDSSDAVKSANRTDVAQQSEGGSSERRPRRTVMDYLDGIKAKRVYPIGRLDYDSEGLLLLTNDGDLTYKLTHPSGEIPKTYIVRIEGTIEESDLAVLRNGVKVDGVRFGRCKVKVTGVSSDSTRLEVVLYEGKNREIRRMFEAVEKNVTFLKRVAIGDLRLGGLSRGSYRELNENEIAYLKGLCAKSAVGDKNGGERK